MIVVQFTWQLCISVLQEKKELLAHRGADLRAVNRYENLPLHFALSYKKSIEVVKLLVYRSPDITAVESDPLHCAAFFCISSIDVIELLLNIITNLLAINRDSCTL